jgi:hypothetical protein
MKDFDADPLCYLATPYSKYLWGIEAAYVEAARITGDLIKRSVKVYSPIVHGHGAAKHAGIDPLDHSIWLPFDEAMMRVADVLIVAHMDGWNESVGIDHEVKFFEERDKPIFDLDPQTLRMTKRR